MFPPTAWVSLADKVKHATGSVSYYLKTPIETHYHIKEKDQLFPLEKVKSRVDLGVRFDSKLTFRDHISEKKLIKPTMH